MIISLSSLNADLVSEFVEFLENEYVPKIIQKKEFHAKFDEKVDRKTNKVSIEESPTKIKKSLVFTKKDLSNKKGRKMAVKKIKELGILYNFFPSLKWTKKQSKFKDLRYLAFLQFENSYIAAIYVLNDGSVKCETSSPSRSSFWKYNIISGLVGDDLISVQKFANLYDYGTHPLLRQETRDMTLNILYQAFHFQRSKKKIIFSKDHFRMCFDPVVVLYEFFKGYYLSGGIDWLGNDRIYEDYIKSRLKNSSDEYMLSLSNKRAQFKELLSIFKKQLASINYEFYQPYIVSHFKKTGVTYDLTSYQWYKSEGFDFATSAFLSQRATGVWVDSTYEMSASIEVKEKIQPNWESVKKEFGGLKGLMKRGITKQDEISLEYEAFRIEMRASPDGSIDAILYIHLNPSPLGKEYYRDFLKFGNQIKVLGKSVETAYHFNSVFKFPKKNNIANVPHKMHFEFPENPTGETHFIVPLKSMAKSDEYIEKIIKLETLFRDEVELLLDDMPNTSYDKENNIIYTSFFDESHFSKESQWNPKRFLD